MVHDVSRELRGYHGRWAKSADALKRMSREAGESRAPMTLETAHAKMLDIRKNFEKGKGYQVNGFTVHNMGDQGLRVRMPGQTKVYKDPREAAVAVFRKQHHEEGKAPIPLPGGAPEPPRAPSGRPHLVTGARITKMEGSRSFYNVNYKDQYAGKVRDIGDGRFEAWQGGKPRGTYSTQEEAANAVVSHHISYQPGSPPPETPPLGQPFFPPGVTPPKRREVTTEPEIRGQHAPKSLVFAGGAKGTGREDKAAITGSILKATTHQGQVTPELVKKTDITVTNTPHKRRSTSTLASHTGQGNTLHIKPRVFTGNNTESTLRYNRGGWWVPTDEKHDLAMNVMTHEFGHGVHGELTRQGVILANRQSPYAKTEREQEFWTGLARSMGTLPPEIQLVPSYVSETGTYMDIGAWMRKNKSKVRSAVSDYGSSNINEMFAELWTEYRLSSNPRPPAKFFGDYVMRKLVNP